MQIDQASSLLILSLTAFLAPLLSQRIRVPAAVGEILLGILLSPRLLGWIEPSEFTDFLADFGFAYLMFLVGMEIDFSSIEEMGKKGVAIAFACAVLVFAASAGATAALGYPPFMALTLGIMSLGIVLVALREGGLTDSRLGQLLLLVGSLGEFLSILLLTGAEMTHQHGVSLQLAFSLGKLVLIFLVAYVLLVVMRVLVWWFPRSFERLVITHSTSEIGVRMAFTLMLAFIAIAAVLGLETILGSFLAGVLFSFAFREKEAIESKLSSFGFGFLIPFFFLSVGLNFDFLSVLKGRFTEVLIFLLVGSTGAKTLGMLPLTFLGLKLREAAAAGVILAAPLTLLIATAKIGESAGFIDADTSGAIILFAILGGVLFPSLFRLVLGKPKKASVEPEAAI